MPAWIAGPSGSRGLFVLLVLLVALLRLAELRVALVTAPASAGGREP